MEAAALAGTHTTQAQDIQVTATAKTAVEVHMGHMTGQHLAEAAAVVTAAGDKSRSVVSMKETVLNLLTKDEVTDIIRGLGYQAIPKDDEDFGEQIFCSSEGIRWDVFLGPFGPFFHEIILHLFSWTEINPIQVVNKWNSDNFISACITCVDSTDQVEPGSDGTFGVCFETRISFEGGVSFEHIQGRITEWVYAVQQIEKLDGFTFLSPATAIEN